MASLNPEHSFEKPIESNPANLAEPAFRYMVLSHVDSKIL